MSADDLGHRARLAAGGTVESTSATDATGTLSATVAARVPAEYRDAYLEGFARVRADRDETAA